MKNHIIRILECAFLIAATLTSTSTMACNKSPVKLPTEEIDFSELKSGQSKIILWSHLPVVIINKPPEYKSLSLEESKKKASTDAEISLQCFVGDNGSLVSSTNPSKISVLVLLPPPIGCAPKIIIPPSKAPTERAAELLKSHGGIIYDSCAGYIFDLDGFAIGQNSNNMQMPKYKIIGTTVILGHGAN